ncbi:hypothetical protein BBAD15_g10500 [Beauveria bassiana D1-5]|uniref:Extracellular membrane protein CFEM domain-containing protein n=1 Tax=Beauveria bassiana D1-5 TaxID=1245745 RepID=A0A0A2VU07_BEABA|nr:hypothetical protein BBAD15_g10500 [Beauveria bassiana D1-5]
MRPSSFLSLSFLLSRHFIATEAANPIFGSFVTPACEACLDAAFDSCPGDYKSRGYAECMCAGEGGLKATACAAQRCDHSIYEETNVVIALATYCVGIMKESCPGLKKFLPQSVYDRDCSSSTTATGTAQTAATITATTTTTNAGGLPSSSSASTTVESKSATPSQTKSASFATAAAVPAWGIFAGLLGQAVQMAL